MWIDLDDPTQDELKHLADELGLHHLAVEDALDPHQRDKYVHYDQHVFLVAHGVELDVDAAELRTTELDVFIGDAVAGDRAPRRRRPHRARRRSAGTRPGASPAASVGVVVYALLDIVVDGYFDTIDRFEAFYDDAADQVFGEHPIEPQSGTGSGSRCAGR